MPTSRGENTNFEPPPLNLSDSETQFKLGQTHRLGASVPKSFEQAFPWIQKSAGKGFAEAQPGNSKGQTNLGYVFADESSEFHNYAKAVKWLLNAAEQGEEVTQEKLAELYFYGRSARQDYTLAAKWYRLAAA